jgi:DNA-binding HxlR family transcriptional regulator
MSRTSYAQFCPVAMAAEVIGARWTMLLLRELIGGTTRFNDFRRGLPRMSPALLSQRLRELEAAGVIARSPTSGNAFEYRLTEAGEELRPIIEAVGVWGQRWVSSELSLQHLDAQVLMWDMRRRLNLDPLPRRRWVVHFQYPERPASERSWWLIVAPGEPVDLCSVDPGYDVDLYITSDLRTMTAIWMGYETIRTAVAAERMTLVGDRELKDNVHVWLGLSSLASAARPAA